MTVCPGGREEMGGAEDGVVEVGGDDHDAVEDRAVYESPGDIVRHLWHRHRAGGG